MTSIQKTRPLPLSVARHASGAAATARGRRTLFATLWFALMLLLVTACGGRALSTDTGNPTVNETRVHVAATDTGLEVTGDPGAVSPGGATVLVFNDTTDDSATTTAAEDGSFSVELAGGVDDDIRVEATTTPPELTGFVWGIHTVTQGGSGESINDGTLGQLYFNSDGTIEVKGTCNTAGGAYAVSAVGRLTLSEMTFNDCQSTQAADQSIRALFSDGEVAFTLTSAGRQLTLTRGDVSVVAAGSERLNIELDGKRFLLESAEGYTPVEGTDISLSFQDVMNGVSEYSEVSFSAGCNSYSAEYYLCGNLICAEGFGSTQIGCDAERHAQDESIAEFFTTRPMVELDGTRLTLRGAIAGEDVTFVFLDREVADPDRPLQGGIWTIDTLIDGGAASSSGSNLGTLAFGANGVLDVQAECNSGEGGYTVDQGTGSNATELSLSRMMYTEEGCEMRELIQEVMTDGTVALTIEANRLTIMRGDIGISATKD